MKREEEVTSGRVVIHQGNRGGRIANCAFLHEMRVTPGVEKLQKI